MLSNSISFRLIGHLVLVAFALAAGTVLQNATGAPAPKLRPPYVLLFVPKKDSHYKTTCNRRDQSRLLRGRSVLYAAVRSLKNAQLPSLPKKGKGEGEGDSHEEDVAWLAQNLKIEYLDGTGVLRVSLAAGSRREQALLVNAVVQAYFKLEVSEQRQLTERLLEKSRKKLKDMQGILKTLEAKDQGRNKQIFEDALVALKASIKQREAALRILPQLLELAEVPPE